MENPRAYGKGDGEEVMATLGELLAAVRILDTIVEHKREEYPAEASNGAEMQ